MFFFVRETEREERTGKRKEEKRKVECRIADSV